MNYQKLLERVCMQLSIGRITWHDVIRIWKGRVFDFYHGFYPVGLNAGPAKFESDLVLMRGLLALTSDDVWRSKAEEKIQWYHDFYVSVDRLDQSRIEAGKMLESVGTSVFKLRCDKCKSDEEFTIKGVHVGATLTCNRCSKVHLLDYSHLATVLENHGLQRLQRTTCPVCDFNHFIDKDCPVCEMRAANAGKSH